MQAIDGDSHFMEPLDLFEQFTDAKYRDPRHARGEGRRRRPATRVRRQGHADSRRRRIAQRGRGLRAEGDRPGHRPFRPIPGPQRGLAGHGQAHRLSERRGHRRAGHLSHARPVVGGRRGRPLPGRRAVPRLQHLGVRVVRGARRPPVPRGAHFAARFPTGRGRDAARRQAGLPHHLSGRHADQRSKLGPPGLRSGLGRGPGPGSERRHSPGGQQRSTPAASSTATAIPASCT